MSARSPINVLVVDDHRVFADALGLALSLEPGIRVVGSVGSVGEALEAIDDSRPDVVLLDYKLPDGVGSVVCRHVAARCPETRVVMLTAHSDLPVIIECAQAGASAFLPKERSLAEVGAAVRSAHSGETLLSPTAMQSVLAYLAASSPIATSPAPRTESFTPREITVLEQLAEGYSNKEIAEILGVSPNTVRTHIRNLLAKLDVHSKLAAVSLGLRLGLIHPPGQAGLGPGVRLPHST